MVLRVVFMGTPALAAHILKRLICSAGVTHQVVGVVTRPDRPRGRGLRLEPSEVGALAARHGLALLKPEKIRGPAFLDALGHLEPDLLVVAAYGRMLPDAVLAAARLMPINVHASLLPRHRGAAPIEGAILAGDATTGVTIMRITSRMDAGPILLIRETPIAPDETQGTLKSRLAELGAEALIEALAAIARGEVRETPQDEALATYTTPLGKQDALIDWNADALRIERMVRAFDPWPVARTALEGGELLVYRARVVDPAARGVAPGTIIGLGPAPLVECGTGRLELLEVQAPGRRRMAAAEFLRGRRVGAGERLG